MYLLEKFAARGESGRGLEDWLDQPQVTFMANFPVPRAPEL